MGKCLLSKLSDLWLSFYEGMLISGVRPYRVNPCDAGAFLPLVFLGRALGRLSVQCPCCSAVRMIVMVLITAWAPHVGIGLVALAFAVALVLEALAWHDASNQGDRDEDIHG